jgi:tetratricopeptide (TPR) repeat protein
VSELPLPRAPGLTARRPLAREGTSALRRLALPIAAFVAVAAPASANGAYFPTSWGWPAIIFGWTAVVSVLLGRGIRLSRLEWAMLGALGSFTAWIAVSAAWSEDVTQTVLEVERALVYLTAALAALLLLRSRGVTRFLSAVLAAIACVSTYSLATRLFPERLAKFDVVAVNRLEQPLGYWNSLGTFTAMGALLALGFAARARPVSGRALAASTLPVLLSTFYFTFGRGAWIALGVGLLAAVALDRRRLQLITTLLVLSPAAAAAIWLSSRSEALTSRTPVLAQAAHDGHRLAPLVLALAAANAGLALAFAYVERLLPSLPRARLAYGMILATLGAAGLVAIFAAYGSPWAISERAYDSFVRAPPPVAAPVGSQSDLNQRLFRFWGNGRADFWRVAWRDSSEHPVLGSGAGTYEEYWYRHRPIPSIVRDAHSLYFETLAELGPPGLALLLLALGMPVVAAMRARRRRLVSAAFGAYTVYLAHAGVDWDWELTAVTLTAFLCGVALLVSARSEGTPRLTASRPRIALLAAALAAVVFSFVGLIGNTALSESHQAAIDERWGTAEAQARKAIDWAPWSSQGWQALAEAQLQQAKLAQARQSFRRALAKDPRDWNLWLELAFASKGAERRAAARRALALNPLSTEIEGVRPAIGLRPSTG